jgi:excisionase family DNA binding protein
MLTDLMTVEEVAARLKLKKSWVYANADRLGAYRLGKYVRFSWPRVVERLEQMNGATNPSAVPQMGARPLNDPCYSNPTERTGRVINQENKR